MEKQSHSTTDWCKEFRGVVMISQEGVSCSRVNGNIIISLGRGGESLFKTKWPTRIAKYHLK